MRTSPFSLSAVAHSLPAQTVHVNQWIERCGLSNPRARALRDHGVGQFHDAEGESPANLATRAITTLLRETATPRLTVDVLIHTHTIQTSVLAPPASTARYIQRHCGLNRALTFSITQQQCVSPMAAIRVLLALAARHPTIERAIIVCADVIGSGCDRLRAIGDLALHSDGACALLLDRGAEHNVIASLHLYTDARFFRGTDDTLQPIPDDRYYWSAFTTMRAAIRQANIAPADIAHVLPHHVNLPGWARLMGMLAIPEARLFTTNFGTVGHAFGADPFINFETCRNQQAGEWSLLFSSGLAGCFGALVIRH
ncbi:3-oxoacyl-[acyl-carrier-protein] synthase III C-terminal domain-containing protein [Burkholderia cenocepacia]|uniref:3-oxoacyl-[acyl-carrier-protein] synthase III C-terminal domain-containing protein n=1 Tax=Burkholderia cenocepacia TaxID=95486 RepID=UPI00196B3D2C|nr:3-oxoacyl-[acyl-carrier-protein] synthase III C-terminal domain-containing protein [Burkholderia cenocepacia]MBN3503098.1 3-oxoacyl-ACP synthase [Burkholderia cenocepacia]MCO1394395.1 3-oxoacyl-ACP synthase [Burkholderia cenocepacia]MCO1404789.1 3-oxoacyl-ACP synthase [Burkholderia cenocepacia]MDR8038615.1 3-oxoacyl-ACP synthase [Burkholderia cenocepacia]UQN96320.1 3-oxoacyl-ACP synthase [Burkholderia cenocepacia]